MPNYLGLLRNTASAFDHVSPDEAQRTLERYLAWGAELEKEGKLVTSEGLSESKGRVMRFTDDVLTSADGPHTEATEIVGGFFVITANDLDEAEKVFSTHPHLAFGPIEVRQIGENGCEA